MQEKSAMQKIACLKKNGKRLKHFTLAPSELFVEWVSMRYKADMHDYHVI